MPNADQIVQFADDLKELLGHDLMELNSILGEVIIHVPRSRLKEVLQRLKDDPRIAMNQLLDISGVDYPDRADRFEVVYSLLSLIKNQRLRVKVETNEQSPVPSVIDVYPSAGWYERECWDLFGISFSGNPDMRRLLNDYDFEGHPLRKDFPLSGFVEVRYDDEAKRIVYEPVKLAQDYRNFDYLSPWEGMTDVVTPPEKAK